MGSNGMIYVPSFKRMVQVTLVLLMVRFIMSSKFILPVPLDVGHPYEVHDNFFLPSVRQLLFFLRRNVPDGRTGL
jgi:hypothetical protein